MFRLVSVPLNHRSLGTLYLHHVLMSVILQITTLGWISKSAAQMGLWCSLAPGGTENQYIWCTCPQHVHREFCRGVLCTG